GARADAYESEQEQGLQDELQRLTEENKKLVKELHDLGGEVDELVLADAQSFIKENKKLKKQISDLRLAQATAAATGSDDDIKDVGGTKFIGKVLNDFPAKDLKPMADDLKKKLGSGVVTLVATSEGKASIVVAVTSDMTEKISAVDLVKIGSEALGGKGGGGRPDMAQAGGPNPDAANDAILRIEEKLA
ncbi:MAG: DHHA1 domain-containing protein, partial [Alphaproteobacteria bacterium]|nr:DHHA1 domain-containing protein [Alphaproteobacteria bacterium]